MPLLEVDGSFIESLSIGMFCSSPSILGALDTFSLAVLLFALLDGSSPGATTTADA